MKRQDFIIRPGRMSRSHRVVSGSFRDGKFSKSVGRTWAGRWDDGTLGWGIGNFVGGGGTDVVGEAGGDWWWKGNMDTEQDKMYLCKVTIEQMFDKNGRPIVRYKSRAKK